MNVVVEIDPAMHRLLALQIVLVLTLMLIAGLHLHWGLGGFWPGHDGPSLVEHVVGRTSGMKPPSPVACFAVVAALTLISVAVMIRASHYSFGAVNLAAAGVTLFAAVVFGLRGVAGYVPFVFAYAKGTPFYGLNMALYSPLCLLLCVGLFWINQPISRI